MGSPGLIIELILNVSLCNESKVTFRERESEMREGESRTPVVVYLAVLISWPYFLVSDTFCSIGLPFPGPAIKSAFKMCSLMDL